MRVAGRAGRAGYGQWTGPLRRLRRRVRKVAAGTGVLALALPLAWQSGAGGQHLDAPSAASIRSGVVRLADFVTGSGSPTPKVPVQQSGTAAGGKHRVPASQTQGLWHVTGQAPGKGQGQLPEWAPHAPKMSPSGTFTARSSTTRGFNPATSTLVQSGTTARSDFYKNADGTYTRKVWPDAVNYQTSAGTWAPIDETLVRGPAGRWQERANSVGVSFAASGDDSTLASLTVAGGSQQVGFSLAGAADVAATTSGSAVTYPGILPGTDVTENATSNGFSESLTLDSAAAGNTWVFPLTLKGLTASLDGGSVDLADAAGAVVAVIPPAVARSGSANPGSAGSQASSQLSYELVTEDGAPALEMSLSPSWLGAPGRVFPVVVDPSVTVDPQGSDYASSKNGTAQTANNSTATLLPSGTTTTSGTTYDDIAFLDFSALGTSEKNYHITSGSLWMFEAYASQCTTAEPVTVYQVTGSWSPSTSMTYPGPAYSTAVAGWNGTASSNACANTTGLTGKGTGMTLPFNPAGITLLNQWTAGSPTVANDGFAIVTSLSNAQAYKEFDSYADSNVASSQGGNCTGNCQPYLSLTYTSTTADVAPQVNSQFPPNNTNVTTLTPELLANGSDADAWPDPSLEYDFTVYDSTGKQKATSNYIASNDWTVPASAGLAWGQAYYWTVTAYDGAQYSSDAQDDYFTTTVPQPLITSQLSLNPTGPGFNPQTGNWTTSATDAEVATVGPALEITRDYNSSDPRLSGAFGAGWSSVLDMKVSAGEYTSTGGTETEVVTYPDGEDVAFGLNSDGATYSPPSGRFATLTAVSGGGFTLTDKNDTTYSFTQPLGTGVYGISSITDADKRTETFQYTGNEITSISSASQRALAISWTPAGGTAQYPHVASVMTDDATEGDASTAQDWTYSYAGDHLQSACPPASTTACTDYTYATGSDYPQAVLDSGPHSYWRLDETSGTTAADSVLANEGADNSAYTGMTLGQDAGPLAGSSATAATFNGSAWVTLPPNLVTSTAYQTISLWFKTSDPTGVLFSSSAQGPTSTGTTTQSYSPELYVGSDGNLVGAFLDGSTQQVMESAAAVDDGQWHNVVLADSGSGQQLYLDGQPIGTLPVGFDSHLESNNFVGAGYMGGGWPDEPNSGSSAGSAYFFDGDISDVAVWTRQLTPSEVQSLYAAATHPAALMTKLTQPSGKVYAQVTYDPLTARVTDDTDSNGGTWQIGAPTTTGSSQAWVSSVLGAKPADYYRLNDTGATWADNLAYDCACSSGAMYNNVTEGVSGGPFADQPVTGYNGTSSYLSLPVSDTASTGGPDSVGVWFKTTGTNEVLYSEEDGPVTGSAPSKYNPVLYIGKDGKLNGEFWDGNTTTAVSGAAVNDGNWHYAVLTAGAGTETLYVDGAAQRSPITGTVVPNEQWANGAAGAGFAGGPWPDLSSSTLASRWFSGDLAELAWYPYQLSAAQVSGQWNASRYANGYTPIQNETVTDPGGNALQYTYDLLNGGRELSSTDADGGITSYTYDTGGFPNSTTDPDGDVTTTGYDPRGNLTSKTTCQDEAAGECSTSYWTYYPDDTSATLTTPAGTNDEVATYSDGRSSSLNDKTYQTTYAYDSAGDLTSATSPTASGQSSGYVTSYLYTDGTDANGGYDGATPAAGLQYQETTPGGAITTTLYYQDGDVAQVTDPDGQRTVYTYDQLGRKLTQTIHSDTFPSGLVTTYTYNANGDLATETNPQVTDRVTGAPHQEETTTSYDADDNVTSAVTADLSGGDASRAVTSTYNQYDQLASQTDAAGDKTTYTYDAYGNKASETDPDGNVTDYAYDAEGHLLTTTLENYTGSPPGSQTAAPLVEESRSYDPAGRLSWVSDAMGRGTEYFYTDNGLLAGETEFSPDGSQWYRSEENSYDGAGNLIERWTNNLQTETTYTVDADDRTTQQVTDPSGLDRTTTISYTPDDQQASVTDGGPDGVSQTTSYTYDKGGNELSQAVTDPGAGGPSAWLGLTQSSGTAVPDQVSGGQPATATDVTWNGAGGVFTGAPGSHVATAGPVADTTGSFTVTAWVDLAAAGAGSTQVVASQAAGTASGFTLGYDASTGDWQFARPLTDTASPALASAESSTPAATGTWTLLTGTYDVSTGAMTLYVNATEAGTATDATPIPAHGAFTIGSAKIAGAQGDWLDGQASDAEVYPRVVSAAQISQLNAADGGADVTTGVLATTWTRDQRGLPTSMTDPDGAVTSYSYDQAGQLTVTTGPPVTAEVYGDPVVTARPVTTTGYDTFGDTAETEDPDGNVTTYGYDADGRPVSKTLPSYTQPGGSSAITPVDTTAYDSDGNVTSATDGLNDTTTYGYDQQGHQVTVTDPAHNVTTTAYDADGEPLSVTDPSGAVTDSTYDFMGRVSTSTQVERHSGSGTVPYTTNDSYNAAGWLSEQTSPDNVTTQYSYNPAGEKTSATNGVDNTTAYSYDSLGEQTEVTNPDGTATKTGYDGAGNVTSTTSLDASGNTLATTSATFDGEGDQLSSTDADGNSTTFTYDPTGMVTQEVQPVSSTSGITTSFGYDAAGNQTLYTDGNGSQWWDTYNSWGLEQSRVEPSTAAYSTAANSTFTLAYDADQNQVTETEPGGVTVASTYNNVGELTGQSGTGADAATPTRTFGYNPAGDMTSASTSNTAGSGSNATSESFTYNDRGQVLTASGSAGSTSYAYNGDGLPTSVADAAGTTSYTYDNADRLSSLGNPVTGTTATYSYNSDSLVTGISYGSGDDSQSFGYDSQHRLTSDTLKSSSLATVASVSYGYDADGEITSEATNGLAGAASNTYTYDEAGRLTSWNNGTTTTPYGYDNNGNLTQDGSKAQTFDARDELASNGTGSYAYTARGTPSSEPGPGGSLGTTFDAYGDQATAGTRSYAYDALGRLTADTASSGASYAFSYVGSTGTMASDGASAYAWDPSGSVLAGSGAPGGGAGGALALTDAHGNQVGQFAAAGTSVSGSQAYDPWGNVTGATGGMTGLLGYQSAWTDTASGKDLMGARWYNSADGDFTSADTVSVSPDPDPAAGNPFAYAADEPLDLVDPTGHYIVPPGGAEGAGTTERVGNGASSPSNWVADVATARIVERAVISAPNDAAKAAAAHAAVARVEAEQATARKAAVAAEAKAARAAAARRAALALAKKQQAARETAEKTAERLLFGKLAMSEAVDVDGGKNITPPGEDLGNDIEFIPVGDQGVETLVNPGHEGPNNDILINPGHKGIGTEVLGNPGGDQGPIINEDKPATDEPADDGPAALEPGYDEPTELHHVLPQQFRAYFARAGINIDDATAKLPQSVHQAAHDVGWNSQWQEFIDANPNATGAQITSQASNMMWEFGLDRYVIGIARYR